MHNFKLIVSYLNHKTNSNMKRISLFWLMSLLVLTTTYAGDNDGTTKEKGKFVDGLKKVWNGELATDEDEEVEKPFPLTIGADLVSRYVWRGQTYNTSPSIQPFMEYSVGNDKVTLTLGTWSSWAFANNDDKSTPDVNEGGANEIDLYASLSAGIFTLAYTDFFYPTEPTINSGSDNFWQWRNKNDFAEISGHTHELSVSLGSDDFPLSGFFSANVGGGGDLIVKDGEMKQGFATYMELDYAIRDGINVFIGAASDRGSGWHLQEDRRFNVVNVGLTASKEIELGKVNIPLSASLIVNPDARNVFFVAAIGFSN